MENDEYREKEEKCDRFFEVPSCSRAADFFIQLSKLCRSQELSQAGACPFDFTPREFVTL
jgi:hypothetical protein